MHYSECADYMIDGPGIKGQSLGIALTKVETWIILASFDNHRHRKVEIDYASTRLSEGPSEMTGTTTHIQHELVGDSAKCTDYWPYHLIGNRGEMLVLAIRACGPNIQLRVSKRARHSPLSCCPRL
jgi:hypothetical protein